MANVLFTDAQFVVTAGAAFAAGDSLVGVNAAGNAYLRITRTEMLNIFQGKDDELTAIAGLTSAADRLPYFTGSGTASLATFTSFGRSLVDDADASTARTTLELGTISTQAANNINISGGVITGTTIDGVSIKNYVDGLVQGMKWKNSVRVATTTNGTLTTAYENGDTIDGVVLATGDRILLKNQSAGAENGIYCVDPETEILTRAGFKRYSELANGEDVLTFNAGSGQAEWQPVKAIHTFKVSQHLVSMEGRGHSSLSTANHRWPVLRNIDTGSGGYEKKRMFKTSDDLSSSDSLITVARCHNLPQQKAHKDELVELLAWFASEGHIRINKSGRLSNCVRIVQSHKVNQGKVDRIRKCLVGLWGQPVPKMKRKRNGVKKPEWNERKHRSDMTVFDLNSIAGKVLCQIAPDRVVPCTFVTELEEGQLELYVETWIDADGYRNPKTGQRGVVQNRIDRVESVRVACSLLGIPTSIHKAGNDCLTLSINKSVYKQPHLRSRSLLPYKGLVWCPETENRTWFAKRNDTVYFTGNTVNASGAPTRATDADSAAELLSAAVFVQEGTANADKAFVCTNDSITLGTTSITFVTFASTLGLGTAANQNTGTSGANVPLLNGANIWSALQTFSEGIAITDTSGVALDVTGVGSGVRTSILRSGNSQTADILTFQDTLNTVLARITSNGSFVIGNGSIGDNGVGVLAVLNGTAPTTFPADLCQVWAEDISTGESCWIFKGEASYGLQSRGTLRIRRASGGTTFFDLSNDGSISRITDTVNSIYIDTPNGFNVNATSGNVYLQGRLINNHSSVAGLQLYVGGVSRECFLAWAEVNSLWRFTNDAQSGPGGFCSPARTPSQITADQNDYSPGVGFFQRWSSDASRSVTGMIAGKDGEIRWIWNVGTQNIVLTNESASSAAANRWACSTGANITLPTLRKAVAQYDATSARWRVSLSP